MLILDANVTVEKIEINEKNKSKNWWQCCTYVSLSYVPGFYIALQYVLTPHSAEQAVHSAGEWSV